MSTFFEVLHATLGTGFGLGYSAYYATPLIFTGLSVMVCFRAGLFNIGAEGQLYMGALAIVIVSSLFPTASAMAIALGILAALLGGGLWGGLAGWLKARGTHEVLTTILLNFVSLAIFSYAVLNPLKNPEVQNPESVPVASGYFLPTLSECGLTVFQSTPVNLALVLAILCSAMVWVLLRKTSVGFELRATGENPRAAQFVGIPIYRRMVLAFAISGALAGLVGVNEVMGHQHRALQGFSPAYGFTGIAVALVGANHPFGILLSAFFFGALHNSTRELEFLTETVTKETSFVIQAILIALVASRSLWAGVRRRVWKS